MRSTRTKLKSLGQAAERETEAGSRSTAEGSSGKGLTNDGKRPRSETAHPQREEHAPDHQGHEDGLGGKAAPRAGARRGSAALRADAGQRDPLADAPHRCLQSGDWRGAPSAAGAPRREERPAHRCLRRQGICRRIQREHHQGGAALHRGAKRRAGPQRRRRDHRPQGARSLPPPLSGREDDQRSSSGRSATCRTGRRHVAPERTGGEAAGAQAR